MRIAAPLFAVVVIVPVTTDADWVCPAVASISSMPAINLTPATVPDYPYGDAPHPPRARRREPLVVCAGRFGTDGYDAKRSDHASRKQSAARRRPRRDRGTACGDSNEPGRHLP